MRVIDLARIGPYLDRLGEDGGSAPIKAWIAEVKSASWNDSRELRLRYPHAEMLAADRVVFHLGEGRHVIAVRVNFGCRVLRIMFAGSAKAYSKAIESIWQAAA